MMVYGDQQHIVATAPWIAELRTRATALAAEPTGHDRHGQLVARFIDLAGLLQGVADAEFAARGHDDPSPAQAALTATLLDWAAALDRSWTSRFADQRIPALGDLPDLPATITIRRAEGYAFYALYPEAVAAAARALPAGMLVIGLRSIGTGLAAIAAAASGAAAMTTVRPVGHPYARTLAIGPELAAAIRAHAGPVALVDEGPGRSGSSFGGAADWLEAHGIARERIVFLPSHSGDLGPEASPAHRARWATATRRPAALARITAERPLESWFADLIGPATAPLRDLSGGQWRDGADIPADPAREAVKYRLATASGRYLVKFAGLDTIAHAKLARARALHAAGFAPEPLAMRHGFLLERWVEGSRGTPDVDGVARYLVFRARTFPADAPGASLVDLMAMARYNLGAALGRAPDTVLVGWSDERLSSLQDDVSPVHVDGRLQPWEWLCTTEGWGKTDALDHGQAHDLVGPQDVAWDVAGAIVEHDLDSAAAARLAGAVPIVPELLAVLLPCYLGFQIGWWSFADDPAARRHRDRLVAKAAALLS